MTNVPGPESLREEGEGGSVPSMGRGTAAFLWQTREERDVSQGLTQEGSGKKVTAPKHLYEEIILKLLLHGKLTFPLDC